MDILITGGAGFIGSSLAEKLLNEGNKVIVVDNFNDYYDVKIKESNISKMLSNPNFTLFRNDICDKEKIDLIFEQNKIDIVVHLAARAGVRPSIDNPLEYERSNCQGTNTIFEMCKIHKINKIIIASSSSVYGNNKKVPFAETDVVDFAISPYAATKKANEVMAHVYHKLYKMNVICLRFFTVYGPKQRPDLAIYKFTKNILNGESICMYGDGETARDYTFIDDILAGITSAIEYEIKHEDVYEIINLGGNEPISLRRMIKTIEKECDKKAIIIQMPMQMGDVEKTSADINKAKSLLKYYPRTSFEEGIKKFVIWFKKERM